MRLPVDARTSAPAGGWHPIGPPVYDVQSSVLAPTGSRQQFQALTFNVPSNERWLVQRAQIQCTFLDAGGFCFDVFLVLNPSDNVLNNNTYDLTRGVLDYCQLGNSAAGTSQLGISLEPRAGYYLYQTSVLRIVFNQTAGIAPTNPVFLATRLQKLVLKEPQA